jgi:hypothetical protein
MSPIDREADNDFRLLFGGFIVFSFFLSSTSCSSSFSSLFLAAYCSSVSQSNLGRESFLSLLAPVPS